MTDPATLWILDQVQNDDALHRFHPLIPCQALGQDLVSFPIKETFAKLSMTGITCADGRSLKLRFPIDSRFRGE